MEPMEKYVLHTNDGNTYRVEFVHPQFGIMPIRIEDSESGVLYDDLDKIEDDILKLSYAKYVFCFVPDTDDPVIVPEKIVKESIIAIHKVND